MHAGTVLAEPHSAGVQEARQARHRGHQHAGVHDRQPHTHPCRGASHQPKVLVPVPGCLIYFWGLDKSMQRCVKQCNARSWQPAAMPASQVLCHAVEAVSTCAEACCLLILCCMCLKSDGVLALSSKVATVHRCRTLRLRCERARMR